MLTSSWQAEKQIQLDKFHLNRNKITLELKKPQTLAFHSKENHPFTSSGMGSELWPVCWACKRILSRCPGCPAVPLFLPIGQHMDLSVVYQMPCYPPFSCATPLWPCTREWVYLACSGGKGTPGVCCGRFGLCISTVQCGALWNKEQWEGLDTQHCWMWVCWAWGVGCWRTVQQRDCWDMVAKCLSPL